MDTLTVIVVNAKSEKVAGANVSLQPSGASGVTNGSGEVQFKLGNAPKYEVTVTQGSNTVTVPYYVTKGGSNRLLVNPVYVKKIEAEIAQSQSGWFAAHPLLTGGWIVGILIVVFVVWKLFRR